MQNGESSSNVTAVSSRPSSSSSLNSVDTTNPQVSSNTSYWEEFEQLLNAHCQRVLQEIDQRFKSLAEHLWADIDQHCAQPDLIHRTFTDNFHQIDDYLDQEFAQTKQELDRALGMDRRRPSGSTYLQPSSQAPSSAYPSGTSAYPSGTLAFPSGTTAPSAYPSDATSSFCPPSSGYPSDVSATTAPSSFVQPISNPSVPFPTQRRSSASSISQPLSSAITPSIATMEYLTPRSSLSRTPTGTVSQEPSRVRSPWSDPPTRAVTPSTALAGGDRVTPGLRTGSLEGGNHGDQALRPQMPGAVFPGDQMLGEHAKGFAGQACACSPCTVQCVCPCPCPVPCPPMPELPPRIVESTETWRRYSKGPPSLFAWGVFVGICAVLLFLYLGSSLPACVRQYIPFIRQNLYAENYSYRRRPYDAFWTSCGTSFLEWWMYTRNLFFNY